MDSPKTQIAKVIAAAHGVSITPISDLLAQVQIDEQAAICPYCTQPLGDEPGVKYGGEFLHAKCHVALGSDLDAGQPADEQLLQMYDEQWD
jgi:hypothetical protein